MEEEKSVRLEKIGPFEYFISFCEEKRQQQIIMCAMK